MINKYMRCGKAMVAMLPNRLRNHRAPISGSGSYQTTVGFLSTHLPLSDLHTSADSIISNFYRFKHGKQHSSSFEKVHHHCVHVKVGSRPALREINTQLPRAALITSMVFAVPMWLKTTQIILMLWTLPPTLGSRDRPKERGPYRDCVRLR